MRNENVLYGYCLSNCCYMKYNINIYNILILFYVYKCTYIVYKNITKHESENTIKQDENLHPNMTCLAIGRGKAMVRVFLMLYAFLYL